MVEVVLPTQPADVFRDGAGASSFAPRCLPNEALIEGHGFKVLTEVPRNPHDDLTRVAGHRAKQAQHPFS